MIDPRLLDRPGSFDGNRSGWRRWKLRLMTWASGIDVRLGPALAEAEAYPETITAVVETHVVLDQFLRAELTALLQGEARERGAEVPLGFEA